MADADDGLRLGDEFPEESVVDTSAGVEGGGYGPGGLSTNTDERAGEAIMSKDSRNLPDVGR